MDACLQLMRRTGKADRPIGDVLAVLEIGDGKGQMPATLDQDNNYIPKNDVTNAGKKVSNWIFVRLIAPADDIKQIEHWAIPLYDASDNEIQRHSTVVVLEELPAPRRAELNTNHHTTITWTTLKNSYYMKLEGGGRRNMVNSDIKTLEEVGLAAAPAPARQR